MANLEWRISMPCRVELTGASSCGKSQLLLRLIADPSVWVRNIPHVTYCAALTEDREDYICQLRLTCEEAGKTLGIQTHIPTLEETVASPPTPGTLLIIDDVTLFDNAEKPLERLMSSSSHKFDISVIYVTQNPFRRSHKLDLCNIGRNLSGRFLLRSLADRGVLRNLNTRHFPHHKRFLPRCLSEAHSQFGLNYVFINLDPFSGLPEENMCYTGMFASERCSVGQSQSPFFFDAE